MRTCKGANLFLLPWARGKAKTGGMSTLANGACEADNQPSRAAPAFRLVRYYGNVQSP